jgi:hypothetical protein
MLLGLKAWSQRSRTFFPGGFAYDQEHESGVLWERAWIGNIGKSHTHRAAAERHPPYGRQDSVEASLREMLRIVVMVSQANGEGCLERGWQTSELLLIGG